MVGGKIGKAEDDPGGRGGYRAWSIESSVELEVDFLADTLLAASICTADGWQPWVVVTVYGLVCSSLHSSLQSVVFGPSLPCLVLLLFSLS